MTSPPRRLAAVALLLALVVGCTRAADEPARDAGATSDAPAADAASPTDPPAAGDSPEPNPSGTPPARPAPEDRLLARAAERGPTVPRTPRAAARQIAAAERAVSDPRTPPRLLAAAGHVQQVATGTLARHPAWDAAVRRATPPRLHPAIAADVAAHREFRSMHPADPADLGDELPAWRIVPPAPAPVLLAAYRDAGRRYGVDWSVLAAINLTETRFGRIRGDSVAGARGPMQFLPSTWELYGEGGDILDPLDAIPAAARLLAANGYARDREAALRRYNDSAAYVRGVLLLAGEMQRRPRAFHGYHQWQVHYLTARGRVWLPEGYDAARPVPVDAYLARNPRALVD